MPCLSICVTKSAMKSKITMNTFLNLALFFIHSTDSGKRNFI